MSKTLISAIPYGNQRDCAWIGARIWRRESEYWSYAKRLEREIDTKAALNRVLPHEKLIIRSLDRLQFAYSGAKPR
jgi:hypothetical protein